MAEARRRKRRPKKGSPRHTVRIVRTESPGAAPGQINPRPGSPAPQVSAIAYGEGSLVELDGEDIDAILASRGKHRVLWVNIDGLGDVALLQRIGDAFGLHPLTLEDCVHVHQRAKLEHWDNYLFIVLRMFQLDIQLESEQLGIVVGPDYVVTFQEGRPGDCLEPVRARLRDRRGLASPRADYLAYAIVDAVTDHHFPILSEYADRLDRLEEEVLGQPYSEVIWRLHGIKRDLLALQVAVMPQQALVQAFMRDPTPLVAKETRLHLRDVADHTGQILDLIASYRELAQSLIEIHLNIASMRLNEVMKVLTLVSVIFIPLTFIAGIYGMNFAPEASPYNMPELRSRFGYPLTLLVMVLVVVVMLFVFWRRGWLRKGG